MGLFDGFKKSSQGSGGMQMPERLAQEAELLYGTQKFAAAADKYAEAVDKIDTMCYAAQAASRIRKPGMQDQPIFAGLNSALGAAMSLDPAFKTEAVKIVQVAVAQLTRVAREPGVDQATRDMYDEAIEAIQLTLRMG